MSPLDPTQRISSVSQLRSIIKERATARSTSNTQENTTMTNAIPAPTSASKKSPAKKSAKKSTAKKSVKKSKQAKKSVKKSASKNGPAVTGETLKSRMIRVDAGFADYLAERAQREGKRITDVTRAMAAKLK